MKIENQEQYRILLIDDHPLIRLGLRRFFETTADVVIVGEAGDGETGLQMALDLLPDLIILDLELPKLTGIEVVRRLKSAGTPSHILAFSGHDDFRYIFEVIRMGVSGYLVKDESPEQILNAVRAICQGDEGWFSKRVEEKISYYLRFEQSVGLTDRELEVFRSLAQGNSNEKIARELGISSKTVEKHIEKLFIKLGAVSRTEAAVRGILSGLL